MATETKRRIPVRTLVIIAGVASAGVLAFLFLFPVGDHPLLSLTVHRDVRVDDLVIEEVRDLYRISSVEYLYRVVFPYDFLDPRTYSPDARGSVPAMQADTAEAREAWNLAKKYHLNLGDPDYHFLVVSVVLTAGFDVSLMDEGTWMQSGTTPEGLRTARITLPKPRILETRIEDPGDDNYPYPDVPVSPEAWRDISGLLRNHAERLALQDGILDKARDNTSLFISRMLLNTGYAKVEFQDDEK